LFRVFIYIIVHSCHVQLLQQECCLQADEDVDKFLSEDHSFDDYVRQVRRYQRLVDEITYKSAKVASHIVHAYILSMYFLFNITFVAGNFGHNALYLQKDFYVL